MRHGEGTSGCGSPLSDSEGMHDWWSMSRGWGKVAQQVEAQDLVWGGEGVQGLEKAFFATAVETVIDRLTDFEKCGMERALADGSPLPDSEGMHDIHRPCDDSADAREDYS
ncbi:hypothetical protein VNO78_10815 [Psophocarpus tetragonolobus]|uniref:Uncharacterized protein n=1 Tax=Psophocarpus tetragonolobus TaxID=3891 RepID=A0AAN9SS19_PSOTE